MTKPKKIAVIRYRFIGDTLLAVPFLRALRQQNRDSEIHLLVGADAHAAMRDCPYIDDSIIFEPRELGFRKAVAQIRQQRYDCAYILKRSFSSALLMLLAGVPERIGFDTEKRGLLLTKRIPYRFREQHEAECFLDLLSDPPGIAELFANASLESWISPSASEKAATWIQPSDGPRIVLHAASSNPAKCWPLAHFQSLAGMLIEQYQAQLYFLGSSKERERYNSLIQELLPGHRNHVINLCGQTSLPESLALLRQMDLVVANDSGIIHMAAAVGTPVVAIFGPMDPQQWRPLSDQSSIVVHPGLTCRPCRMKISCDNLYPCLREILPQQVFNVCQPYLTS